ncbi:serine protease [Sagittula sp.]|uniref:trypsin-like serine peptidase n=2 Tax=Sagittula sp. TaxID=2038081 RepID=UPI003512C2ED
MRLTGLIVAAVLTAGAATAQSTQEDWLGIENEVAVQGYNNEPISTYDDQADFRKMGRGVGMLSISTDGGTFPCTAFLVSEKYLLTNHHCVPGVLKDERVNATKILAVDWLAGFHEPGRMEEAERFAVNPEPVETSEDLDYTVLEVTGNPAGRFPPLPLAATPLRPGMPYWIIGHPMGKSQHISREGCRAADPPMNDNRLRHTCDTLGGNSGSPIIDSSARQVVGLHNSGNSRVGINFGIPMTMILSQSKVLKAAPPAQDRPLPLVMTLYPDALGVGQEVSVVADMPDGCTPAFVALSPSSQLTPIPLDFFQKVPLGPGQVRYQISPGGRYGLVIEEGDEKGAHKLGFLCGPGGLTEPAALQDALRGVVASLSSGQTSGEVASGAGPVGYAFRTFEVR